MERRPEASAHKDPEKLVMSGQPHFKSDLGELCIITQQPDQSVERGRNMKFTISKIV